MPLPPPAPLKRTLYIGNFVDTPRIGQLQVRERTLVAVDEMGVIRAIKSERNLEDVVRELGWDSREVEREGEEGEGWWAPGFVGKFFLDGVRFLVCCFVMCLRSPNAKKERGKKNLEIEDFHFMSIISLKTIWDRKML